MVSQGSEMVQLLHLPPVTDTPDETLAVHAEPADVIHSEGVVNDASTEVAPTGSGVSFPFDWRDAVKAVAASGIIGSGSGILYMYFYTWYVVIMHGREPCDAHLALWLSLCLGISLFCIFRSCIQPYANLFLCFWSLEAQSAGEPEPRRVQLLKFMLSVFGYFVVISATNAVKQAKTCSNTAPALYDWAAFLALPGALLFVVLAGCMGLACLVLAMFLGNPEVRGADPSIIGQLETVEAPEDEECSICLEVYASGSHVKKAPCCGKLFHEGCFKIWLQGHRTCPLCRADLQVEMNGLDPLV